MKTGKYAVSGKDALVGIYLALDEINANDTILKNHTLDIAVQDSKGSKTTAFFRCLEFAGLCILFVSSFSQFLVLFFVCVCVCVFFFFSFAISAFFFV